MTENASKLPDDRALDKNDAAWLRDIAEYSENAEDIDGRYLWPEDKNNLRRIADLLEASLQANDEVKCRLCGDRTATIVRCDECDLEVNREP